MHKPTAPVPLRAGLFGDHSKPFPATSGGDRAHCPDPDSDSSSSSSASSTIAYAEERKKAVASMRPSVGAKGYWYRTGILDPFPGASMRELQVVIDPNTKIQRKVYLVDHEGTNYVLKTVMCPKTAGADIQQARLEYAMAQKLSREDAHIIRPLDLQELDTGADVCVETLLDYRGTDLRGRVGEAKAGEIVDIARKTLEPLAFLEKNNIFHSDIKPGNILVNAAGEYTIIDFGVARQLSATQFSKSTITLAGKVIGLTEVYAPPESFTSAPVNMLNKIDVYGWGMTIYELASRKSFEKLTKEVKKYKEPFNEAKYKKFLAKVKELSIPGDLTGNLTAMLVPVLMKALAFNPAERPSFAELYRFMGMPDSHVPSANIAPAPAAPVASPTPGSGEIVEQQRREIDEYASKLLIEQLKSKELEDNFAALSTALAQRESELAARPAYAETNMELMKENLKEWKTKAADRQKIADLKQAEAENYKNALEKTKQDFAQCREDLADLRLSVKDKDRDLVELKRQLRESEQSSSEKDVASTRQKDKKIAELEGQLETKDDLIRKLQQELKSRAITEEPNNLYMHDGSVLPFDRVRSMVSTLQQKFKSECDSDDYGRLASGANTIINNGENGVVILGASLHDTGAQILALCLRCTERLKVLSLGCCQIGPAGAQALGQAIRHHQTLERLYLGVEYQVKEQRNSSKTGGTSAEAALMMLLLTNGQMQLGGKKRPRGDIVSESAKSNKRQWNRIGSAGVKAIADGLRNNQRITYLDLSLTDIGDSEVSELADALKVNQSLKKLYLYLNEDISDRSGDKYNFRGGLKVIYSDK